ncbi:Sec-independent protein translocase protein TatB [Pelagerythrobacter rhizovicinus]|uniref:Sec-independent protein translocase protein TatB n=1 Tax=Pelagerythrobacter rhizovicinus TaxID=2268576 RepID=A0A4Q2KLQ2_9SPHN|nr:Sec-independent protein translocase protein TatB [Pelagerythrobacter rhizovicinus]RXZ64071.1 twin-arginine translocase subunit TatB [Pelagerythrobacter rhizovicinus]
MFDIGATELLVIVIVAVIVIGPKDLPLALRTAGRWIGKVRRVSGHFRSGIETMIREAEMEEMEKKWREQNARIMAEHSAEEGESAESASTAAESRVASAAAPSRDAEAPSAEPDGQPRLPLGKPESE